MNSEFFSLLILIAVPRLKNSSVLLFTYSWNWFLSFTKSLILSKTQTALSRIWTQFAMSISKETITVTCLLLCVRGWLREKRWAYSAVPKPRFPNRKNCGHCWQFAVMKLIATVLPVYLVPLIFQSLIFLCWKDKKILYHTHIYLIK